MMRRQRAVVLLLSAASGLTAADAGSISDPAHITIDWQAAASGVLKTDATLQVVSNPLLDKTFHVNGTEIANPIYSPAWQSLKDLGVDYVRFQPWFPFPHKSVAELDPPKEGEKTSWNFTSMLPQVEAFMNNTAGHPVIWNFGTIPCWLFWGPTTGGCTYPANPDEAMFAYGERGIRAFLRDQSAETLAEYFTRLFSYMINGFMVDENEVLHSGGPGYNMSQSVIEFLNEGEHYYSSEEYVHDYDVVVSHLQRALHKDRTPRFMGIGGCHDGHWNWWVMGECTKWLTQFLDRSRHSNEAVPLDFASIHFYASSSNRSNPSTYTRDFFGAADRWLVYMQKHVDMRNTMSPGTKLALTELGVLELDDESRIFGPSGGLPDIFFNAAGAFYAYIFGHISVMGVEIACFSQFVGSPPIPQWGIPEMQFPSGSMLSWETGFGNAKYWALFLLKQHLSKGDNLLPVKITQAQRFEAPRQWMCEAVGPWTFTDELTISCANPKARITHVWADMGLEPSGACGNFKPNVNCSSHFTSTAMASLRCLGRHSCTLRRNTDFFTEMLTCPKQTFRRDSQLFSMRLTVQAACSGTEGGHTSAEYTGDSIFALAFTPPRGQPGKAKLLIVNKENEAVELSLQGLQGLPATAHIVDPESVTRSSQSGVREEQWTSTTGSITLQPFSVIIAELNGPTLPDSLAVLV